MMDRKLCSDAATNRYTDAVVADIANRIHVDFPVSYYGGSTFMNYKTDRKEKRICFPAVVVGTNANFTTACGQYLVKNEDGNVSTVDVDYINTYPYVYGITVNVMYDSETEDAAKEIEHQLRAVYEKETEVWVDIPSLPGKKSLVKLCVNPNPAKKQDELVLALSKRRVIEFTSYYSVYLWEDYDLQQLNDDPIFQYVFLQRTEFAYMLGDLFSHSVLTELDMRYKPFLEHKKILMKFFEFKEYVRLKDLYDRRQPISREVFNAGLPILTGNYPTLYDKFMRGVPFGDIRNEVVRAANVNQSRFNKMFAELHLPECVESKHKGNITFNTIDGIRALIAEMSGTTMTIEEAVKHYIDRIDREYEEQEKAYQEQLERNRQKSILLRQERAEMGYDEADEYSGGDSGHSFIRDAAAVAVGTAVGNRISDKRRRREQEERDRRFEDEQRRKDSEERHRRAVASQREWERVKKLNDERRRKGLPELPLPDREWW